MIKRLIFLPFLFVCATLTAAQYGGGYYRIKTSSFPVAAFQGSGEAGGGTGLSYAYNSGKTEVASSTSITVTVGYTPSTNTLIAIGCFQGQSSFTTASDNWNNVFTLDKFATDGGNSVGIWHFVATATYIGSYKVKVTNTGTGATLVASVVTASNTATTASVDVSTNIKQNVATSVSVGTSPVASATAGLQMSVMSNDSGVNDSITASPNGKLIAVANETDGTVDVTGSVAYSTSSLASAASFGQWTFPANKTSEAITVIYKTP